MASSITRLQRSASDILLKLLEKHNLYHVKTLRYNDSRGLLDWLGAKTELFPFGRDEDTIDLLRRYLGSVGRTDVGAMALDEESESAIRDKKYLVVYVKHRSAQQPCKYDSLVLFLVLGCNRRVPPCPETDELLERALNVLGARRRRGELFPAFAARQPQTIEVPPRYANPVMNGYLPWSYDTVEPRSIPEHADGFGCTHEASEPPVACDANPWVVFADVPRDGTSCLNLERLIASRDRVLGRGGFGVTVKVSDALAAKVNLFPEMVNWSKPFVDDRFYRYAHVACQTEEVMIGVSMKHPNVLRTFGGYWCDIRDYQLGGRAVVCMERALLSLQEFMHRLNGDTSAVPLVELDTLQGLEYLRSRRIQHRDLTFKNILVCHQPDRNPLPFAFKISDFGTACNFSTPNQTRGNRVNMAPEVLWCMNTALGSDVFSWYCVMWELYNRSPLIGYRGSDGQGYCKKTYARNLSELVGVYTPDDPYEAFETARMRLIEARSLYEEHKNKRPSVQDVYARLQRLNACVKDEAFVRMGLLCITLFPQERWSPSQLLNLTRYRRLSSDVGPATSPSHPIPARLRLGEYETTDVIVSEDCVPSELRELARTRPDTAPAMTEIDPRDKVYYGVDLLRLAPGYIQPYEWYRKKAQALESLYKLRYKRVEPGGRVRPAKMICHRAARARDGAESHAPSPTPEVPVRDASPPTPSAREGWIHEQTSVIDSHLPDEYRDPFTLKTTSRGSGSSGSSSGSSSVGSSVGSLRDRTESAGGTECLGSASNDSLIDANDVETPGGDDQVVHPAVPRPSLEPRGPSNDAGVKPEGLVFARKLEGEIATNVVILKSENESAIALFETNAIRLSRSMTGEHPHIFAGPHEELCARSSGGGLYVFQYGQLFDCKKVSEWTERDAPNSKLALLLQVFLTLRTAAVANVLPSNMTLRYLVAGRNGAVMIDIVAYLCSNFTVSSDRLFGDHCAGLTGACEELVATHLPGSNLHKWLRKLRPETRSVSVLSKAIDWLRKFQPRDASERTTPRFESLASECFTFKDYLWSARNWLDGERGGCSAKVLVYGNPKIFRGNQFAGNVGATNLDALVKNILLRLKVKVFGSSLVTVTALDCTQGLTKVTLANSALAHVPSVTELNGSTAPAVGDDGCCYTHDLASDTLSKWAPVVMFKKITKPGPVRELNVEKYQTVVLITLLSPKGAVGSLGELFRGVSVATTTEY